jgi:hypothetical protein
MLLDEGWPITEVANRLGDDVQTVAKTYAHKMRDSERDLSFLDALGSGIRDEETETVGAVVPAC